MCFPFKSIAVFLLILDFQQVKIKVVNNDIGSDCTEIFAANSSLKSGAYKIQPNASSDPFEVFCEKRENEGWTVIQRRNGKGADGNPVNFGRPWDDYQRGFGHVKHEHWLGLEHMHDLTNQRDKTCQLLVDMFNCKGEWGYAFYDSFSIGSEHGNYSIFLGNYKGNTGDAFRGDHQSGSQNAHPFSTPDSDNDDCDICLRGDEAFSSCAGQLYGSGWWFSNCGQANLNGNWHPSSDCVGWVSGIYWETWRKSYSLIFSEL
ncbi:Angiopoietin-related protein 5, partial [Varanus komodoensis]